MSDVIVIKNELERLRKLSPKRQEQLLRQLAQEGEADAKMLIQQSPATGVQYGDHIASSPGNPPRSDTGTLIGSIRAKRVRRLQHEIVAGTDYAGYLEFGNTRGMEPRPFMGPMARNLQKKVPEIFDGFLEDDV